MTNSFECRSQTIATQALTLDFTEVPWDSALLSMTVAEIRRLHIEDVNSAGKDYQAFLDWCSERQIGFCSCRMDQNRVRESFFLQERGFRFVELNYRPTLVGLQQKAFEAGDIQIREVSSEDTEVLADIAESSIEHGRFHQDPHFGASVGRQRYRNWLVNALREASQEVLVCTAHGSIVALFVVEFPAPEHCFWSLIGFAPSAKRCGLGTKVWSAMLAYCRSKGFHTINTSISSHNVPVLNLYAKLGFRFPMPQLTLHWHRLADSRHGFREG